MINVGPKSSFIYPTEAQFEVLSLGIVPGGPPCQIYQQNIASLQAFETTQFSSLGIPAGSHGGTSTGGLGPELQPGAPAGVRPDWGVIGLSHSLACFPMWATAAGRPRGTIWKQHDPLQCRTGIHYSGYREQAWRTRNTKLEQRCLLDLKRLPFGLLYQ